MAWTSTMKRPPAGTEVAAPTGSAKPIAATSNPNAAIRILVVHFIANPHRKKKQVEGLISASMA
jgi:hypothetical protein